MECLNCEKCNYTTTNKQNYERHLQSKRHLEERTNEYYCEKCQYATTNKQNFERHLQSSSHLEEKINEYKCEKCQYTTKNKQNFEIHLQSKKHTEEKQKFKPIFCSCCEIQLCTSKQHMEHKKSIKHKKNLHNYKPPAPSPVPVHPAPSPVPVPRATVPPVEPKKSGFDPFSPFYNILCTTPEIIKEINQVLKEKENIPEDTERIRVYARKIGDDYKVGVISLINKDYFQLGLLKKEKLKEITIPQNGYKNVDDYGYGGFHHILGYITA